MVVNQLPSIYALITVIILYFLNTPLPYIFFPSHSPKVAFSDSAMYRVSLPLYTLLLVPLFRFHFFSLFLLLVSRFLFTNIVPCPNAPSARRLFLGFPHTGTYVHSSHISIISHHTYTLSFNQTCSYFWVSRFFLPLIIIFPGAGIACI